MDNSAVRTILLILLILYIVSPVDAFPGLIDDILLLAAYLGSDG